MRAGLRETLSRPRKRSRYHLSFLFLILLIPKAGPQVLHGVGAPGSPPFCERCDAPPVARVAETADGLSDPEVRGKKRVGVAERPHRNVRSGPRTYPPQLQQPPFHLLTLRARVEHDPTSCKGARKIAQGFTTRTGNAESIECRPGYGARTGEEMGRFAVFSCERLGERFSAAGDEAAGERAGAGHGDLLAKHCPEGEFGAVHSSRYAPPRRTTNERAEQRVRAEHIGDGDGVGVEVEERAASLYRATEVPHVLEPEHARDVIAAVGEGHDTSAVRKTQRPPVGLPIESLYTRNSASAEKAQHTVRVERCPERQPEWDLPAHHLITRSATAPQRARGYGEDVADRVVELAYTRESCGERYLGDGQICGLDEQPGCVGAPRAGERERTGSNVRTEQAAQVALRVAEPPREPRNTVPVDDAVSDEPHRPRDDVGPGVPFRRARHGVGSAPLAGAETGVLCGGRGRKKADVGPLGSRGRTTGPAVDPRRGNSYVEPSVEADVAPANGSITMFEVL